MARYNGLIIPRSYNDYFSRSDPQAIRDIVALAADGELNAESKNPLQNQAIAKIVPNTASETNKLADKNFVNSTVGTNTANYIYKTESGGEKVPFSSVAELEAYAGTVTNNDYAFVTGIDENGNAYYDRYKADVNDGVVTWAKEYRLNNSSFTAEQWAAIQSGITAEKVAQFEGAVAPVDVVQSGNMRAVTSNAVADGLNEVMPTGTILSGMWKTAPKGFLLCDGTTYQTSQYQKLANVLGATGDTFKVPDLREVVLVGVEQNKTLPIAAHDVYTLGQFKDDQIQNITGSLRPETSEATIDVDMIGTGAIVSKNERRLISTPYNGNATAWAGFDFDASRVARTGDTTHGKQFGVNYVIKY